MIFTYLVVFLMLVGAIAASFFKDLVSAVISAGFMSMMAAILFYFLQAPDVALAEGSIGAALVTAIFIIAIKRTGRDEE